MSHTLDRLTIEGYKSIRKLEDFELRSLNVLIGANGAGKSNFVGFFRLLRELVEQRLQLHVQKVEGGADACLHMGPKTTKEIAVRLRFGPNGYEFKLVPAVNNRLVFSNETAVFFGDYVPEIRFSLGSGQTEANLKTRRDEPGLSGSSHGVPSYVFEALSSWVAYHFHDTSNSAGVRRQAAINDNEILRSNGENLAPFLYRIRKTHPKRYEQIRDVVRLANPFFDDFNLRPVPGNEDLIQLEWLQKESDYPFQASQLSDGSLRFICMATALLQPNRPRTVLFDEPELGLHPHALTLLASLIRAARLDIGSSVVSQVIISTQSVPLLNEFEPEDVIVVEREHGQSTFRRLDSALLAEWLQDYSLGELWQKNVLGGRPAAERGPELIDASVNGGDGRS